MFLYLTELLIEDFVIQYEVYKEGKRLFFKPLKTIDSIDVPIFWVEKTFDAWNPMNIEDERFIKHVREDISKHEVKQIE
jgi:hypothetical protein